METGRIRRRWRENFGSKMRKVEMAIGAENFTVDEERRWIRMAGRKRN